MQAAYRISLSPAQFAMIGEICAIQGQIEYLMQSSIQRLLEINTDTLLSICPRSGLGSLAKFFIVVARDKCASADLAIAETANSLINSSLAEGRNDFVHALYAHDGGELGFSLSTIDVAEPAVAIRTGSRKKRSLDEIDTVRNEAARVSRALAAFHHRISIPNSERTVWDDTY